MKQLITMLLLVTSPLSFALTTGEMAPDFKLPGLNPKSKEVSLSDYRGKYVVLEWLNYGCPFVHKHYDSGNMQMLQKKYTGDNVIWFSIISSAPEKQGYVDEKGAIQDKIKHKSSATDVLLDPTGKVGRLYEAKTTPHMYIIDKEGKLAYQGAIDDHPDTDQKSIPGSKNFVDEALQELIAGKKVTAHTTRSYGCAVKY